MNSKILVLTLAVLVTGCASTGVIKMGENYYMLGKKDGAPGLGISLSNKAAVYSEANEFCARQSLEVQVIREVVLPARPAQLGSTEIQFKCVPRGAERAPLKKEADKVIEIRGL
jgi:hypothetical protein